MKYQEFTCWAPIGSSGKFLRRTARTDRYLRDVWVCSSWFYGCCVEGCGIALGNKRTLIMITRGRGWFSKGTGQDWYKILTKGESSASQYFKMSSFRKSQWTLRPCLTQKRVGHSRFVLWVIKHTAIQLPNRAATMTLDKTHKYLEPGSYMALIIDVL